MADPERENVRVSLGWATLQTGVELLDLKVGPGVPLSRCVLRIPSEAFNTPGIEYLGVATVDIERRGVYRRHFTGLVDRIVPTDDVTTLYLVGFDQELSERGMGGLDVLAGANAVETIYSILRLTDFEEENMDLEGFRHVPEAFMVVAPLTGIAVRSNRIIGDVTVTATEPAGPKLPDTELFVRYKSAGAWAFTTTVRGTVFDAEVDGTEAIDAALALITLLSRHAYPSLVERSGFERDWIRSIVRRDDVIYVGSLTSRRGWLRGTTEPENITPLDLDAAVPRSLAEQPLDPTIRQAAIEWRKAAYASDPLTSVTHLWRAIELYASRGRVAHLFSGPQLRGLWESVPGSLTRAQRTRIEELVGRINEAPLLVRLDAALERDHISLLDGERTLLRETRTLRNDMEHAGAPTALERRKLARALALVNRVLVGAMLAIREGTAETAGSRRPPITNRPR